MPTLAELKKPKMNAKPRIVTVCEGGTVRSVSLALVLKQRGVDALALSWRGNSIETIKLLCIWADRILLTQGKFKKHIPKEFHNKITVYELGPDVWGNAMAMDLLFKNLNFVKKDKKMPPEVRERCTGLVSDVVW